MTAAVDRPSLAQRHSTGLSRLAIFVVSTIAAIVGWAGALAGPKGLIALVAGLSFVAAMIVVERRQELILAVGVLSVGALLHKSFTPLAEISSGPPSIYVTSFDIMVFVLYFAWFVRDPWMMRDEIRSAFRDRIMWLPVIAAAAMLPSVLVAGDTSLAFAELVRMASMFLVFVYFAVRIRTKQQLWIVLGALMALLSIEAIVVAGQYVTSSALGLSVFGTPSILHNRFDGIAVARPFGTLAHPVFMGAFVAPLALLAYSLAVNLKGLRIKWVMLGLAGLGVTPILLASARSASLGIVIAFAILTLGFLVTGRLPANTAGWWMLAGLIVVMAASPYLLDMWSSNFATEHFSLEWESRSQLNDVAFQMFEDSPFVGHGLNNFETAMGPYDRFGLIFAENPVHNVYLLQAAETGIIGLAGMMLLVFGLLRRSLRLSRSRDRLYSAIGFGVSAAYLFWGIEELLVFSLRQDHPRALFFILSGTMVAASRMARADRATRLATPPPRSRPPQLVGSLAVFAMVSISAASVGMAPGLNEDPADPGVTAQPATTDDESQGELLLGGQGAIDTPVTDSPDSIQDPADPDLANEPGEDIPDETVPLDPAADWSNETSGPPIHRDEVPIGPTASENGLAIVLTAVDRLDGLRRIYTTTAGSEDFTQVSPEDGRQYSWAVWGLGGNKIIFTARSGQPGSAEPIYWMNADGSGLEVLVEAPFRLGQPKLSADGRTLIFVGTIPNSVIARIYSWDLATGTVRNISELTGRGYLDSDPRFTPDNNGIVFIDSGDTNRNAVPGNVALMGLDGQARTTLPANGFFDTDPDLTHDGSVITARYVGEGSPGNSQKDNPLAIVLEDWVLVERQLNSGAEHQLTDGNGCFRLPEPLSCTPTQGASFLPIYTPDDQRVGYVSILSENSTCICTVGRDGTDSRALIRSQRLALNWFDWVVPTPIPDTAVLNPVRPNDIPVDLLVSAVSGDRYQVFATTADRFSQRTFDLPQELQPREATWNANRDDIIFTGTVDPDIYFPVYTPLPPPGETRRRHWTLSFDANWLVPPPLSREGADSNQLFSINSNGTGLRQLTTPYTEDYRDAIPDGERRGNMAPDLSPDGRYVVFTNVDLTTTESFIMRLDLVSGEVLSLTNATVGALPAHDLDPAWSPDGSQVAFASDSSGSSEIWVMDADGRNARPVTNDDNIDRYPSWSPDGQRLSYSTIPDGKSLSQLRVIDLKYGTSRALVIGKTSTMHSSWSPDGKTIAFTEFSELGLLELSLVASDGTGPPRRSLSALLQETAIDWG